MIRERWMQQDSSEEGWKLLGHTLLEKLNSIHAWDQALSVGLKMAELQKTDRTLYKSMIVAAFHAGNQSIAEGLVERFAKMQTQSQAMGPQSRLPASADGYDDVVKEIESRKTGAK